ncbi:Oidioi.mRNA.OKI2018_I69.PAR.g11073.t1.cds [Oikopleura dioica]|uniref:Oidioi.mRNA.OKI2018_I69.PAR.g11073.t1.cds n=1 Tax=Oikopleura dioica TaxID=34765 RepID=A0ABN7RTU4_OIKDI|nr:Oidioi.mRNA.OKI2018_I69.PAR.g11073.t1.cds [Oikopleura dioica]
MTEATLTSICPANKSFIETTRVYNNPQPRKKSYKSVPTHGICFDKDTLVDLASDGKEKMYSDGVKIGNWFEDRKKICQKNWYCDQNVDLSTRDVTPSSHVDYKKHKCVGYEYSTPAHVSREIYTKPHFLFKHHGNRYETAEIRHMSTYERECKGGILSQKPRTDFMNKTAARHANERAETRAVKKSTVHASFQPHSLENKEKAEAIPKSYSSRLEPISRINKNLHFRNRRTNLVPDSFPNIELIEAKLAHIKAIREAKSSA